MPIPEQSVRDIRDRQSLLEFLVRELQWKLPQNPTLEEVTFEWSASELRLNEPAQSRLAGGSVLQLRAMTTDQPWGIFIVNFADGQVYKTALRQVLRGLVPRRRRDSNLPAWKHENILFICTTKNQEFTFAHFKGKKPERAKLVRFSWSPDEPIRTLCEFNLPALRMPEDTSRWTEEWTKAFDVEAVTKRFYQEIANWYFWACNHVAFPIPKTERNRDAYISQSLIRLITRLIFCWFVKEMGLIRRELFDLRTLSTLLKDGAKLPTSKSTTFYKAILQNLFFATLNQEIGKRQFRKRNKDPHGRDPHHGITNLYRYEDFFTDPKAFLRLMEGIPFLNGGLFECLDKVYRTEENLPDIRIDGFSDHPKNPLSVPDFLFFGEERTVDLSEAYGQARYRRATVRGLIHIFNRYNFTVTESTPLDQEVALDPELAGKVFENLLAAYNPETATTARKQTGSFYTPREIVDYMVDEALIAYLATKLNHTETRDSEKKLRHLLAYTDEPHQFSKAEVNTLIAAIDNLKALDPACGSGAFPMGLLHKLVFILGKLDPRNEQWKERQIERVREAMRAAERIEDAAIRERTLKDLEHQIANIEDAFARGELDYGRKLYLIENCIYGVDIQPIAVQIAKMRFFISLTIDQKVDPSAPNLGIRPLPNLETKFVAANTLIGIERSAQAVLRNPQIDAKEAELRQIRERHFTARTPATKAKCRELDAKLRAEISQLLRADGFPRETTEKLANWNPYDQNASADFFDPEWMFGIREGFDIVIGNPPYVRVDELHSEDKDSYRRIYSSTTGKYDLYYLFLEHGFKSLSSAGTLCFITPNKFCAANSAAILRRLIFARSGSGEIVSTSKLGVFEAAANYPVIGIYRLGSGDRSLLVREAASIDAIRLSSPKVYWLPIKEFSVLPEGIIPINVSQAEIEFAIRLLRHSHPIGSVFSISEGLRLPMRYEREEHSDFMIVKQFQFEKWTVIRPGAYISKRDLERVVSPQSERFTKIGRPKIIIAEDALQITATIDETTCVPQGGVYFGVVTDRRINMRFMLGLLNSRLASRIYEILFGGMHMGGGYLRYRTNFLETLPIPDVPPERQQPIIALVDKILVAKRADPSADTSAWEREIDQLVYRLYGLTEEEIKIVEGGTR